MPRVQNPTSPRGDGGGIRSVALERFSPDERASFPFALEAWSDDAVLARRGGGDRERGHRGLESTLSRSILTRKGADHPPTRRGNGATCARIGSAGQSARDIARRSWSIRHRLRVERRGHRRRLAARRRAGARRAVASHDQPGQALASTTRRRSAHRARLLEAGSRCSRSSGKTCCSSARIFFPRPESSVLAVVGVRAVTFRSALPSSRRYSGLCTRRNTRAFMACVWSGLERTPAAPPRSTAFGARVFPDIGLCRADHVPLPCRPRRLRDPRELLEAGHRRPVEKRLPPAAGGGAW